MTNLFLDLDGVMVDLEGDYLRRFGHKMDDAESKAKMWSAIYGIDDFFYHLPPLKGAIDFYRTITENHNFNPIILTACPSSAYHSVAKQKMRWVRKYLSHDVMVLPVYESASKPAFMQDEGDILIDDYGRNCRAWEEAGGIAIQHKGTDFDSTFGELLDKWHVGNGRNGVLGLFRPAYAAR